MDTYLFISPVLGAVIGYITNWIAIKMLFRPHEAKYLFGIAIPFTPGLIPKRRQLLAKKVGDTISAHLLTDETLIQSLLSDSVKSKVESAVDAFFQAAGNDDGNKLLADYISPEMLTRVKEKIENNGEQLTEKIKDLLLSDLFAEHVKPMAISVISQNVKGLAQLFVVPEKVFDNAYNGMLDYLNDEKNVDNTTEKIIDIVDKLGAIGLKDAKGALSDITRDIIGDTYGSQVLWLKDKVLRGYEKAVRAYFPDFLAVMDLPSIIENKINAFEIDEAERIIISVVERELQAITYFGGILGFLIGLAPMIRW